MPGHDDLLFEGRVSRRFIPESETRPCLCKRIFLRVWGCFRRAGCITQGRAQASLSSLLIEFDHLPRMID